MSDTLLDPRPSASDVAAVVDPAHVRRRSLVVIAAAVVATIAVYKLTSGTKTVPSWLDFHVQKKSQDAYGWITDRTGRNWFLNSIKSAGSSISWCVRKVVSGLQLLHWTGVLAAVFAVCFIRSGWRQAATAAVTAAAIGFVGGLWDLTMITVAMMVVGVAMALIVGVPVGVLSAKSERADRIIRPILDTAQVMPAFVYLIPLVSLFGIGYPSAVIATFIYAAPPAVRLTNLGIRQIPVVATEVGRSYGTTGRQLLAKVELPLARPTIALGLNQVIMMAFGIVVIASLVGTGDVGGEVVRGLQKANKNLAYSAGLCIVFAAIALDRMSSSNPSALARRKWKDRFGTRPTWLVALIVVVAAALAAKVFGVQTFPAFRIHAGKWAADATDWVQKHATKNVPVIGGTGSITQFVVNVLNPIRSVLQNSAWWLVAIVAGLIGWKAKGWRLAAGCASVFVGIAAMRNWKLAMDTLSQVVVAVIVSVIIALPLGIWYGRSRRVERVLRPILETAQVLPQFVYLVPMVFLFDPGRTPGMFATIIYAIPPGIRLIGLGLHEVPFAPREAATSFGASPRQELMKVQLPLALKAIMLGINQVIMMALATVIIAGLIGGGGLGLEALSGFTKTNLKLGDGMAAGISIVLLAVFLDRVTQAWGDRLSYSSPEK